MDFLGAASLAGLTVGGLADLLYGIIRIVAVAGLGAVFAGIVMTSLCDLLECRKWKRCHGQTEVWHLMH